MAKNSLYKRNVTQAMASQRKRCGVKARFYSPEGASQVLIKEKEMHAYHCINCGYFHIGHY